MDINPRRQKHLVLLFAFGEAGQEKAAPDMCPRPPVISWKQVGFEIMNFGRFRRYLRRW
jgi:hypothetical protein